MHWTWLVLIEGNLVFIVVACPEPSPSRSKRIDIRGGKYYASAFRKNPIALPDKIKRPFKVLNPINTNHGVKKFIFIWKGKVHVCLPEVWIFNLHQIIDIGRMDFYSTFQQTVCESSSPAWYIENPSLLSSGEHGGYNIMCIFGRIFWNDHAGIGFRNINEMGINLKVLHLSSEKTWRGGEQQIAYLIEELSGLGVDNYVALRSGSVFENYCKSRNIPFIALPFRNTMDLQTAFSIRSYCKRIHIDLIHMHSAKSHGIGVLSAVLGNQTPLVLSRRVDFIPKNNWLTQWRYNHNQIKRILGVSDKITSIMKAYVKRPERCLTVHSGIDIKKFPTSSTVKKLRTEYDISDDFKIIGNTSALEGHKDYPTFIETVKKLLDGKIKVKAFIIGDGSQKDSLIRLVKEKSLERDLYFTGFRKDVHELLPGLDLFLITSETEGLGTSVLDAFAAGVPVVATNAGGIPEMVVHRETGMLCNVRDTESLASSVVELFNNPALRDSIVKKSKARVQEFSKRKTAEQTYKIYREIIAQL
jgi:L-malate glycosyltransferase